MEICSIAHPSVLFAMLAAAAVPSALCCLIWFRRASEQSKIAFHRDELERFESYKLTVQSELNALFHKASSEALSRSSEQFLKLAHQTFESYQNVSHERISASCGQVGGELYKLSASLSAITERRAMIDGELVKQIEQLAQTSAEATTETVRLRRALTNPRGQGMWGEEQLRNLLKHAGMLEFADFVEQSHIAATSDSSKIRPDVIVKLPNGYQIAIDAKAPLKALVEAPHSSVEDRSVLLADFRDALKRHIRELSNKKYNEKIQSGGVQYTILFLPSDALLTTVYELGEDLVSYARELKILIATPSSLLVLLCSAAALWRDQALLENAKEIETLGKQLYQRLLAFSDSFGEIGNSLERTIRSYNSAAATLETRLLVSARRFAALGVGEPEKLNTHVEIDERVREIKVEGQVSV